MQYAAGADAIVSRSIEWIDRPTQPRNHIVESNAAFLPLHGVRWRGVEEVGDRYSQHIKITLPDWGLLAKHTDELGTHTDRITPTSTPSHLLQGAQ